MKSIHHPAQQTFPFDGKVCSHCHICKHLSEYNKSKKEKDGLQGICRACFSEYNRLRYIAKSAEIRQTVLRYYRANREKKKEYQNQHYHRNRHNKEWYDARVKKNREWKHAHPDIVRSCEYARLTAKHWNGGSFTAKEWRALKAQYQYYCLCCGKQEPEIKLTVDHVIPLSKGGRNDIANIQPLCFSCNSSKRNKHIDYRQSQQERKENTG